MPIATARSTTGRGRSGTELEASWESIFDLNDREEPLYVQATVTKLRADDVVRAINLR